MRRVLQGIHHCPIMVPGGIDTLDFSLTKDRREELFRAGHSQAHTFLSKLQPHWASTDDAVEATQKLYAHPDCIAPLLRSIVYEFGEMSSAKDLRTNIMLPTGFGSQVVTYYFGMDGDPDRDLQISMASGCAGRARTTKEIVFCDLNHAKAHPEEYFMQQKYQVKVKTDRQSVVSIPIFVEENGRIDNEHVLGVLSVDSSSTLSETGWVSGRREEIVVCGTCWARVLSRVLRR